MVVGKAQAAELPNDDRSVIAPYYDHAGITIYHGDCRDILPHLPKVDLVLTDPPYGINYHSGHYIGRNPHAPIVNDDAYPVWAIEECRKLVSVACLFFCRWDNLRVMPSPASVIAWIKNNWTAGNLEHNYARAWEAVAVYNGEHHAFRNGRPPDVVRCNRVPAMSLLHPTQKPIELCQILMNHHSAGIVLDPFMGSGTTLVAAKNLGLRAIGIEIEEKYCEIAARRLAQEVFPFQDGPRSLACSLSSGV